MGLLRSSRWSGQSFAAAGAMKVLLGERWTSGSRCFAWGRIHFWGTCLKYLERNNNKYIESISLAAVWLKFRIRWTDGTFLGV